LLAWNLPGNIAYFIQGDTHISITSQRSQAHQTRAQFWKSVPMSSRIVMLSGVFTLFASMGFVQLLMATARVTVAYTLAMISI